MRETDPGTAGRLRLASGWLLAIVVSGLVLFRFANDQRLNPDSIGYFSYLPDLVVRHTLDFSDEFTGWSINMPLPSVTRTGLVSNMWQAGTALLWLPFYLLAKGVVWARRLPIEDPSSPIYVFFTNFGSAVYGLLAVVLAWDGLERLGLGRRRGLALAVALLGTPAFYYMTVGTYMSHACSMFMATLYCWLVLRLPEDGPPGLGEWFLLGAAAGVLVMVRPQNALYVPFACVRFVGRPVAGKELGRAAAGAVAGFLFGFAPQMVLWHGIYGRVLELPLRFNVSPLECHLRELVLSPHRGLLFWTPATLLALVGFGLGRARREPALLGLGLVLAAQFYPAATHIWWGGGESFGIRILSDAFFPVAAGLALLLGSEERPRLLALRAGACAAAALWTTGLLAAVLCGYVSISRYEPLQRVLLAPLKVLSHPGTSLRALTATSQPTTKYFWLLLAVQTGALVEAVRWTRLPRAAAARRIAVPLAGLLAAFLALAVWAHGRTSPRYPVPPPAELFSHEDLMGYYVLMARHVECRLLADAGRVEEALRGYDRVYAEYGGTRAMAEFERRAGGTRESLRAALLTPSWTPSP